MAPIIMKCENVEKHRMMWKSLRLAEIASPKIGLNDPGLLEVGLNWNQSTIYRTRKAWSAENNFPKKCRINK